MSQNILSFTERERPGIGEVGARLAGQPSSRSSSKQPVTSLNKVQVFIMAASITPNVKAWCIVGAREMPEVLFFWISFSLALSRYN